MSPAISTNLGGILGPLPDFYHAVSISPEDLETHALKQTLGSERAGHMHDAIPVAQKEMAQEMTDVWQQRIPRTEGLY